MLLRNYVADFVEICNICVRKAIIEDAKRIINSDKVCHSYSDLNFGVTFLEHSVYAVDGHNVPSYLAANMACPGDVDVRYSIHSRLSVDVMPTGNLDGMLEPQNRAAVRCTAYQQHFTQ